MNTPLTFSMKPAVALALLAAATLPARADDERLRGPMLPLYVQECGSCHVAYAPGLLGAASWQRLMGRLQDHFGSDASVDAASAKTIAAWLDANAGTYKKVRRTREAPPQDRITRAAWFTREHDELRPDVWQRASVKSAANCEACHTQAASGSFREREIRIPK
ncbi:MAG: diheme cytochrome c [Burkholderiaceae bacterium]